MAVGFPAHAERERRFDAPLAEIVDAVFDTLDALRWKVKERRGGTFRAGTGMGFRSYGERIDVQVKQDGTVRVASRCSWPLQMFDWGKNQSNLEKFFDTLKRMLRRSVRRAGEGGTPRRGPTSGS